MSRGVDGVLCTMALGIALLLQCSVRCGGTHALVVAYHSNRACFVGLHMMAKPTGPVQRGWRSTPCPVNGRQWYQQQSSAQAFCSEHCTPGPAGKAPAVHASQQVLQLGLLCLQQAALHARAMLAVRRIAIRTSSDVGGLMEQSATWRRVPCVCDCCATASCHMFAWTM